MEFLDELTTKFTLFDAISVALIFSWSGFVRAGLGFGGAALSLPLLLLIDDAPLFFLPIIALHLLFFSGVTVLPKIKNVHWPFIKSSLSWMIVPKLMGVIGLFSLPVKWMVLIIYGMTIFYSVKWILKTAITSQSAWSDRFLLILGGYFSGTSLTGAPLIISVAIRQIPSISYRDTLFVLWFILVNIKVGAFVIAGVNLQWQWALALLIPTALGHITGNHFHQRLLATSPENLKQVLGAGLLVISIIGIAKAWQLF